MNKVDMPHLCRHPFGILVNELHYVLWDVDWNIWYVIITMVYFDIGHVIEF